MKFSKPHQNDLESGVVISRRRLINRPDRVSNLERLTAMTEQGRKGGREGERNSQPRPWRIPPSSFPLSSAANIGSTLRYQLLIGLVIYTAGIECIYFLVYIEVIYE